MRKVVAVCGTFDTKGEELSYLAREIRELGMDVITLDMSTRNETCPVTYTAADAVRADGGELEQMKKTMGPSELFTVISDGAGTLAASLVREGRLSGVICMAGGRGTFMACRLLRRLPIGLPKVLISTIATNEGIQHTFAGINDTMVINPLVDVAGLNPILCAVMKEGAATLCGMVNAGCALGGESDKVRIGITMWGVTTPCVEYVRKRMEKEGYEVLVFHANGLGGSMMDKLVEQGYIHVVADLTLSEITQPLCRGELTESNAVNRMVSACRRGVPQVVSFGGIDMVYPSGEAAHTAQSRKQYHHTAECMFYRSNAEENRRCAKWVADRLNDSAGDVTVLLPLQGTSAVDKAGEALYEPETDRALFDAVHAYMKPGIRVIDVDAHINDESFADAVSEALLRCAREIRPYHR